jgi:hypothetical protein
MRASVCRARVVLLVALVVVEGCAIENSGLPDWKSGGPSPAEVYRVGWIAAVPVYALGAVTGTPFLPLALLRPEQRLCLMC